MRGAANIFLASLRLQRLFLPLERRVLQSEFPVAAVTVSVAVPPAVTRAPAASAVRHAGNLQLQLRVTHLDMTHSSDCSPARPILAKNLGTSKSSLKCQELYAL